jgi:mRNA interferase YafQ
MLDYEITGSFQRDRKVMEKRRKDIRKLQEIMSLLINEQPLLPKHENHPLHGNYEGKWECHVEPDWLLIYRAEKENHRIIFYRTGSHSDLF